MTGHPQMSEAVSREAEKIEHGGRLIAIIARKDMEVEGIKFLVPDSYPLQFGVMAHKAGTVLKPHIHKQAERLIKETHEMIHVDYGKTEVDLYTDEGKKIKTIRLGEGDTILFVSGGHGFRFIKDTKMTEIKQGPYKGRNEDKSFF